MCFVSTVEVETTAAALAVDRSPVMDFLGDLRTQTARVRGVGDPADFTPETETRIELHISTPALIRIMI